MDFMRWLDAMIDWFTRKAVKADTHGRSACVCSDESLLRAGAEFADPADPLCVRSQPLAACADFSRRPSAPSGSSHRVEDLSAAVHRAGAALDAQPQHRDPLGLLSLWRRVFALPDVVPGGALLAFSTSGSNIKTRVLIFAQIIVGLAAFYRGLSHRERVPSHIPVQEMVGIGVISAFCAATYVIPHGELLFERGGFRSPNS